MESHLLQMRGLKQRSSLSLDLLVTSHLLQMRGLKLRNAARGREPISRIFYRCVD